jgi:hypothetical protein
MPEISRFLGVVIKMFHREHGPPHFHARYGGHEISVEILSGRVGDGSHRGRSVTSSSGTISIASNSSATGSALPMQNSSNGSSPSNDEPFVHVVEARHRGGHRVWLRFDDGLEGELDLAGELSGGVFEPLKDPAVFRGFVVDETLVWPNGADFAPEFLHDRLSASSGGERDGA